MIPIKIDRLIGILTIIMQRSATSEELAEKFEVSQRTIVRDIDTLSLAGIPVTAAKGRNGGYSVMEGYSLDRTLLSKKEMGALLSGLAGLDSISGSPKYRRLMEKLSPEKEGLVCPDSCFIIDLSGGGQKSLKELIELIRSAAAEFEMLSFRYVAPGGESIRKIEPYNLVFRWKSWYVWGYCTKRRAMRLFRLSRMAEPEKTGEKFTPRDIPLPGGCGSLEEQNEVSAVVKFDSSVKWRVIDELGPDRIHESGSSFTAEFTWSDKTSFQSFVLSFGDRAEVISPPSLRREIAEMGKRIAGINAD